MSYDIIWFRLPKEKRPDKEKYSKEEYELFNEHSKYGYGSQFLVNDYGPFEYEGTGLNITSNLCRMFSWAINKNPDINWRERIDGLKGSEITPILKSALERMENNKEEAEKYDSKNGWGVYDDGYTFLKNLMIESVYYKDCYLEISY